MVPVCVLQLSTWQRRKWCVAKFPQTYIFNNKKQEFSKFLSKCIESHDSEGLGLSDKGMKSWNFLAHRFSLLDRHLVVIVGTSLIDSPTIHLHANKGMLTFL